MIRFSKSQIFWLIVIGLTLLYFASRLVNLTIIPIFVDEAIYTRWSQIILNDPQNNLFIPLSDGKQPLYMWVAAQFLRFFRDPLMATRITSIVAGAFGALGTYLLTKELFNKKVGVLSVILFIFSPFLFFYNRLAVVDGMLTTFFIFEVWAALMLVRKMKWYWAAILGVILGLGVLTKTTAAIGIIFIPLSLLFFKFKSEDRVQNLLKLFIYWAVALAIAFVMYRILKLSPLYYLINQRTPDFIFTPKEVLKHPLDPFLPRIKDVLGWLNGYLTWPIFGAVVLGFLLLLKKSWRAALYLGAFFLGPLLIEMQIAKGFTPRYFIFVAPIALVVAAYLIENLTDFVFKFVHLESIRNLGKVLLIVLILVPGMLFEYLLMISPEIAPIPEKEKTGYLEEWSAGYGIPQIANYLMGQAKNGQAITVGTEGIQGYGTLPDGLEVYLRDVPNVTVVGMGQRADIYQVPKDLINDSKIHLAYLVVNDSRLYDKNNKALHLIAQYPKANGGNPLDLYQVIAK